MLNFFKKPAAQFAPSPGLFAGLAREQDNEKLARVPGQYRTAFGTIEVDQWQAGDFDFEADMHIGMEFVGRVNASIGLNDELILSLSKTSGASVVDGSDSFERLLSKFVRVCFRKKDQ